MQVHDFHESLAKSHAASDLPIWEEVYRNAFGPLFSAMVDHRDDGEHQRAGIDRSVILTNSKQLLIDEKVRHKEYRPPDILLEFISNDVYRTQGWACKPLRADYIAYAVLPTGVCYMLPVIQLQRAWAQHGEKWKRDYGIKSTPNHGYNTLNTPVPVDVLFRAIGAGLRVRFAPC